MTTTPNHSGHPIDMPAVCQLLFETLIQAVLPPYRASMPAEVATTLAAELAKSHPKVAVLLCDYLSIDEKKYMRVDGDFYGSSLRPRVLNVLRPMVARQAARDAMNEIENLESGK